MSDLFAEDVTGDDRFNFAEERSVTDQAAWRQSFGDDVGGFVDGDPDL